MMDQSIEADYTVITDTAKSPKIRRGYKYEKNDK
jgi:hypothetical protein